MGYTRTGGLGLQKQGRWEPIIVEHRKKNMGLGYDSKDVVTPNTRCTSFKKRAPSTSTKTLDIYHLIDNEFPVEDLFENFSIGIVPIQLIKTIPNDLLFHNRL